MKHVVEMWLERGGERRLCHVEADIDFSNLPRMFIRSLTCRLSDDWVEIAMEPDEIAKAMSLLREVAIETPEQLRLRELYEDHVRRA